MRETLHTDLQLIKDMIPAAALEQIMKTQIFFSKETRHISASGSVYSERGAVFHPGPEWLVTAGSTVKKAKCVDIYRVDDYLDWRSSQPFMILHELGHSYHYIHIEGPMG